MDAGSKALDLLRHPKIDDNAVRTKITEMQDLVFSAQRALGEAEEENRSLKRRIEDLQRVVWRQLLFPVNDNYFSRRRQLQTC